MDCVSSNVHVTVKEYNLSWYMYVVNFYGSIYIIACRFSSVTLRAVSVTMMTF